MSEQRHTVEAELLADVAARCVSPADLEAGRRRVNEIVATLLMRLRWLDIARTVLGALGLLTAAATGVAMNMRTEPFEGSIPVGVILTVILWTTTIFSSRWLQMPRGFLQGGQPYAVALPAGLDALLDDMRSGRKEAGFAVVDGTFSAGAVRSADGRVFDRFLGPGNFRNRYAPILFSSNSRDFAYLYISGVANPNRPICLVRNAATPVSDKSSVADEPREGDAPVGARWLTNLSQADFDRRVDAYLKTKISPHQWAWYRIVLEVGREELLKGPGRGSKAMAVRAVKAKLCERFGNDSGPNGGNSEHLIKRLLNDRLGI